MESKNNPSQAGIQVHSKRFQILLLRSFFKLLYHQFSWAYDWVASIVSLDAWKTWVLSLIPLLNGPKILEIGFGTGHLQAALKQKGITTLGIDESCQMGRISHRRLKTLGLPTDLVRGNAQNLPFANRSINQVVATFPSEFIFSPSTYLEIHRVLADSGECIILPVAWITGQRPLEKAIAWLNRITGETPTLGEMNLEAFQVPGFEYHAEILDFPSSKLLLVRLRKISA